jgi:NitT/TauT family transport system substrate-binding protein
MREFRHKEAKQLFSRFRLLGRTTTITVGIAGLILIGCGRSPTSPKPAPKTQVSVRFPIPIVESGQTTFYVAQDKGYYAAENLDVKFEMGSQELNPVKTVATGQDTFGILGGPDTLLVARSKGQPLKAIAIIHRHSNFSCLLTLKSSGITSLEQLQAKKIGFNYGHISTDVLRSMLHKEGIKYTEVDVGFDYSQLITGRVAAEWAFTVTAGLDLPAKGVEVNIISPASYGIVTDGYTIFATDATITGSPDLCLRFLRASLKGVRYTVDHPEEANQILLKRDPSLNPALSLKRQLAYNAVTSDSDRYPPGYMDASMFQTAYARLAEEKVIQKPFNVSDAYTAKFLEEIYGRPFVSEPQK